MLIFDIEKPKEKNKHDCKNWKHKAQDKIRIYKEKRYLRDYILKYLTITSLSLLIIK